MKTTIATVALTGMMFTGIHGAFAAPSVGVDVATPNVRVRVGTPQPPLVPVVVERERVVVHERDHHDNGKHKGHYKKYKKERKHHRHD